MDREKPRMSTLNLALFIAGFITCEAIVIVLALSACRLAGAADDAADQALHDLANGEAPSPIIKEN